MVRFNQLTRHTKCSKFLHPRNRWVHLWTLTCVPVGRGASPCVRDISKYKADCIGSSTTAAAMLNVVHGNLCRQWRRGFVHGAGHNPWSSHGTGTRIHPWNPINSCPDGRFGISAYHHCLVSGPASLGHWVTSETFLGWERLLGCWERMKMRSRTVCNWCIHVHMHLYKSIFLDKLYAYCPLPQTFPQTTHTREDRSRPRLEGFRMYFCTCIYVECVYNYIYTHIIVYIIIYIYYSAYVYNTANPGFLFPYCCVGWIPVFYG
jgi:hypothetical protein